MPPTGSYYTSFAAFSLFAVDFFFFFLHAAQTNCQSQRHALMERQEGGWRE